MPPISCPEKELLSGSFPTFTASKKARVSGTKQTSSLVCAELQAHFEPASETEGVEKDADEVEDDCHPVEQNGNEEPVVTSGVSTLGSVVSHESQQQHLNLQLAKLKQETNRYFHV